MGRRVLTRVPTCAHAAGFQLAYTEKGNFYVLYISASDEADCNAWLAAIRRALSASGHPAGTTYCPGVARNKVWVCCGGKTLEGSGRFPGCEPCGAWGPALTPGGAGRKSKGPRRPSDSALPRSLSQRPGGAPGPGGGRDRPLSGKVSTLTDAVSVGWGIAEYEKATPVFTSVITKSSPTEKLGITFCGPTDLTRMHMLGRGLFIKSLAAGSPAAVQTKLAPGHRILELNGVLMADKTHPDLQKVSPPPTPTHPRTHHRGIVVPPLVYRGG